jgi:hypothetical protein
VTNYVIISVISGVLFGILDGLINANPVARRLLAAYEPIAKKSVNFVAGILIDLAYGFIMAGVFLLLYASLPGASGLVKGLSFGLLTWFFRVVMSVASEWMTYNVAAPTLLYKVATGLVEMLVLGVIYGLTLKPLA